MTIKSRYIAATLAIAGVMPGSWVRASESGPVLSLTALAVVPEDPAMLGRTTAGSVTISIERWSTDPDLEQLGGTPPEALLAKLRSATPRVGAIRRGSITVADLLYAREEVDRDTKDRRLVIVTDRPLRSWNLSAQAGPLETPELTVFDIRLTRYGTGDGRLVTQSNLARVPNARPDEGMSDPLGPIIAPICLAAVSTDSDKMISVP